VSSRLCWFAGVANVALDLGQQRVAHVSGVQRCGSPWSCPTCAPVVRERRAGEIDLGLSRHLDGGGGAVFLTLTVPHHRPDRLVERLDVMARALGLVLKGAAWERRRARLGYVGAIRAVEVTWGEANGWHPHTHAVLLFDRPLTDAERDDLEAWVFAHWVAVCERHDFGAPTRAHGVDLRPVTGAGDLAGYLTKVEGGWGPGLEVARADLKRSTKGDRLVPVQFLERLIATGEKRWADLWREYEAATFGKHAIVWGRGLRDRLLPDVEEVTDVEAAAAEGADVTLLRALVSAAAWNSLVRSGHVAQLLTDFEHVGAWILTVAHLLGYEPPPLDGDGGQAGGRCRRAQRGAGPSLPTPPYLGA
jgi:hypothetical protein